jgi:hypothetical protein
LVKFLIRSFLIGCVIVTGSAAGSFIYSCLSEPRVVKYIEVKYIQFSDNASEEFNLPDWEVIPLEVVK